MRENVRHIDARGLSRGALFAALASIGAFIQIPVPYMDYFTLQFFFILLAGLLLGSRLGALSIAVYVALGLLGFPIFAAGGGITYVLRPSFGYLIGFIAGAATAGYLIERRRAETYTGILTACLCALVVTYMIGLGYKYFLLNTVLNTPISLKLIILSCFPLDLPGDLLLCFLAAGIARRLRKERID